MTPHDQQLTVQRYEAARREHEEAFRRFLSSGNALRVARIALERLPSACWPVTIIDHETPRTNA